MRTWSRSNIRTPTWWESPPSLPRRIADKRLLYADYPRDWDRYNLTEVVFRPKTMQPTELSQVIRTCVRRMYDLPVLKTKAKRTLAATGSWEAARFAWEANMNYRNIALSDTTFC